MKKGILKGIMRRSGQGSGGGGGGGGGEGAGEGVLGSRLAKPAAVGQGGDGGRDGGGGGGGAHSPAHLVSNKARVARRVPAGGVSGRSHPHDYADDEDDDEALREARQNSRINAAVDLSSMLADERQPHRSAASSIVTRSTPRAGLAPAGRSSQKGLTLLSDTGCPGITGPGTNSQMHLRGLGRFLTECPRFEVPVFQRRYTWGISLLNEWWRDATAYTEAATESDGDDTWGMSSKMKELMKSRGHKIGQSATFDDIYDLVRVTKGCFSSEAFQRILFHPTETPNALMASPAHPSLAKSLENLASFEVHPWSRLHPSYPDRDDYFRGVLPVFPVFRSSSSSAIIIARRHFDGLCLGLPASALAAVTQRILNAFYISVTDVLTRTLPYGQVFQYLQEKAVLAAASPSLLTKTAPNDGAMFGAIDLVRNLVMSVAWEEFVEGAAKGAPSPESVYRGWWVRVERLFAAGASGSRSGSRSEVGNDGYMPPESAREAHRRFHEALRRYLAASTPTKRSHNTAEVRGRKHAAMLEILDKHSGATTDERMSEQLEGMRLYLQFVPIFESKVSNGGLPVVAFLDEMLYVGKIPRSATERDVRRHFEEFGRIRDLRLLVGFAFVEYEDYRDARDAIDRLDGSRLLGERITVEQARTQGRAGGRERRSDKDRLPSKYRLMVENLPSRTSWQRSCLPGLNGTAICGLDTYLRYLDGYGFHAALQSGLPWRNPLYSFLGQRRLSSHLSVYLSCDWLQTNLPSPPKEPMTTGRGNLKDLMRKAGEVVYTDVDRDGVGFVEFTSSTGLDEALKMFDDYEYEGKRLIVKEDKERDREERERKDRERRDRDREERRGDREDRRDSRRGSDDREDRDDRKSGRDDRDGRSSRDDRDGRNGRDDRERRSSRDRDGRGSRDDREDRRSRSPRSPRSPN
ncbi:hypothetical protein DFJ73DRAFT_765650 [Zopfochytrium polystomum]|nr:hypothetical protein DFJ73DRAFT_765650 [Zopfochytrium polystomum]